MSLTFRHIALIGKHHSAFNSAPPAQARQVLTSLTQWLKQSGAEVFLEKDSAQQIGLDVAPTLDIQGIADQCDLALVVGGDGTMLGFGRQLAPHGVPLIGINQGRLGFITDIALNQLEARLEPMLQRLAAGGFAPFEAPYYAAWLHSGQRVQLQEGEGQQATWVTVEGLSPHGYLLASDAGVCAHACSRWHAPPRRSTQRHNPPLQSQGASGTSCTRMATAWTFFGGWCAANCQPDRDSGWVCAHRFPLLSHTHTVQQHAIAMQRAGRPQRR